MMGLNELSPKINRMDLAAQTALTGWNQGIFLYLVYGLNYFRFSSGSLTVLDQITLLAQVAMHLFTLASLPQRAPRLISVALLALVAGGSILD